MGLEATKAYRSRTDTSDESERGVCCCALGDIFGDSQERGIFRSTDCGESWEARALRRREKRRGRSDDGPEQSAHHVRYFMGGPTQAVEFFRPAGRAARSTGRRTAATRGRTSRGYKGLPRWHQGAHGSCDLPGEGWPRLGHHRGRGPGPLSLRRPWRDVGARIGRSEAHPATRGTTATCSAIRRTPRPCGS